MAVIGKIREKSLLLLIVVGGALMAFVLTDLFSSGSSMFGNDYENIGSIDGHDIRGIEFENKYTGEVEDYKIREKVTDVPEYVQGQLRDQVWNQYLNDLLLGKELDELGVKVSVEELGDMTYGDNPHSQVLQAFTNPKTGAFNKNDVINFLKNLDRDETGKTKNQWLKFEAAMKQERKVNKYYTLIQKGLYVTAREAEDNFKAQNRKADISFVIKRYSDIADSTLKVDDNDLKRYYNSNRYRFKEKRSRKIEYAIFGIMPSPEDSSYIEEWVNKTYAAFIATTDDSAFVNANSDDEFDYRFYSVNDNNKAIDTSLFLQDTAGFSTMPEIVGDSWKMVKISAIKHSPDSVEARHLLLSFTKATKEKTKLKMDSIKTAIQFGSDFAQMAAQFSVDPGSKDQGGNLGWFKEGFMIPVINDSSFSAELNKLMIIESPFGLHLLQVTSKSPVVKKLQVAIINRSLDASRETVDKQFTAANDFSIKLAGTEDMKVLADEFSVPYNMIDIRENDNMIPEIESSRGLIRWAYGSEENQVSEALQYGNNFVVARLKEIHEEGIAPMESVKAEVEIGAIKDKKAEKLIGDMKGFTDLDGAAKALELTIMSSAGILFDSYSVPGLGREPVLIGKIYAMDEGDLSVPIKGDNGVYIVRIDKVEEMEKPDNLDYLKEQLFMNRSTRVGYEVFEALKERVDIVDNRHMVY